MEVVSDLKLALSKENTVILQAPPGAGKSTVLPLELMDAPWLEGKKILMLEPRRLAARSVAQRMASLLGQSIAQQIGYRVRFDTKVGPRTQLEVVTEGILTRMMQEDNALEDVGMVIFDEFHERSIHADLGLVMCRQIQEVLREDLRILIMSATLNLDALTALCPDAPLIQSAGRQFPVDHIYLTSPSGNFVVGPMVQAIRQALKEQEGDILAFLPGAGEIRKIAEKLTGATGTDTEVYPLYGDLAFAKQEEAIRPSPAGRRKVVLATSIAETSLTIEGIKTVIDSGLARIPHFDPRSGLTRLETVEVTRDAADQRAGRAGRLGPGICYRLWEKGKHQYLQAHRKPEIMGADLSSLVLELANWGITDIPGLDWPTAPPPAALAQASGLLESIDALENSKITPWGKRLIRFPSHPRLAHLMLKGHALGVGALAADISAVLEERDPLGWEAGADICRRLDALRDYRNKSRGPGDRRALSRLERVSQIWQRKLKTQPMRKDPDPFMVGRLLAEAYPERIARKMDADTGRYRLFNSRPASLKKEDPLLDYDWVAAAHVDGGVTKGRIFLGAPFDPEDLAHRISEEKVVVWDKEKEQLVGRIERKLGSLLVSSRNNKDIDREVGASVICEAIRKEPSLLPWEEGADSWMARLGSLRHWRPDEGWPEINKQMLLDSMEEWLKPYLGKVTKAASLLKIDLVSLIAVRLPWELNQQFDRLTPTHIPVPSGSNIRLQYFEDGRSPVLAVRLQEVFGMLDTPSVNSGREKVMVHLLSPARRPVQVTQDLRSFWENTYAEVRKELRGRYLKHYWPEDPFTAQATSGIKKKKRK